MTADTTSGLFECALSIARQRAETLAQLRRALEQGAKAEALELARRLCGLEPAAKERKK